MKRNKDLKYYRENAEDNYMTTPISVLRYISELEQALEALTNNQGDFLKWCNTPICSKSGGFGYTKRVTAQAPDYDSYSIIDETGDSLLPDGTWLSAEELYEYWSTVSNQL
jgi:hypothetical protein